MIELLAAVGLFFGALGVVVGIGIGEKRGIKSGRSVGRAEGVEIERLQWWTKAHAAKDAGTPWAGIEYPVEEEELVE